jgi:hypothetical protein
LGLSELKPEDCIVTVSTPEAFAGAVATNQSESVLESISSDRSVAWAFAFK